MEVDKVEGTIVDRVLLFAGFQYEGFTPKQRSGSSFHRKLAIETSHKAKLSPNLTLPQIVVHRHLGLRQAF